MATRYLIRLPAERAGMLATAGVLAENADVGMKRTRTRPELLTAKLDEHDVVVLREAGATLYEDVQFDVMPSPMDGPTAKAAYWRSSGQAAVLGPQGSLADVMDHIKAPAAWAKTRGRGATVVIVDTGICGRLSEFDPGRRSTIDLPTAFAGKHWADVKGHGSMCAAIAAGSRADGGRYDGVAPEATVLAARTTLSSSDLLAIFDELIQSKRSGALKGPVVISNSYGLYTCSPPAGLPSDHPYLEMVLDAIDEGMFVAFAAGNNHHDVACNHPPDASGPNTIWGVNSHDRVVSVGTVDRNNSNQNGATAHANSSRGPGQWAEQHPKPDCVAPTYGDVVWGCGHHVLEWWGTSGACPQVAGLAALLLSVDRNLSPRDVADIIRSTCDPLDAPPTCVGSGLINCEAAVGAVGAVRQDLMAGALP